MRADVNSIVKQMCALWLVAYLQEEWFTDPDGVRFKVGLLDEQPSTSRKKVGC